MGLYPTYPGFSRPLRFFNTCLRTARCVRTSFSSSLFPRFAAFTHPYFSGLDVQMGLQAWGMYCRPLPLLAKLPLHWAVPLQRHFWWTHCFLGQDSSTLWKQFLPPHCWKIRGTLSDDLRDVLSQEAYKARFCFRVPGGFLSYKLLCSQGVFWAFVPHALNSVLSISFSSEYERRRYRKPYWKDRRRISDTFDSDFLWRYGGIHVIFGFDHTGHQRQGRRKDTAVMRDSFYSFTPDLKTKWKQPSPVLSWSLCCDKTLPDDECFAGRRPGGEYYQPSHQNYRITHYIPGSQQQISQT